MRLGASLAAPAGRACWRGESYGKDERPGSQGFKTSSREQGNRAIRRAPDYSCARLKYDLYDFFRGVLGLLPFFFLYKRPKNTP